MMENVIIAVNNFILFNLDIVTSLTSFWIERFGVQGSRVQGSARPPAKTKAGLIEKETNERLT
jgi:hypothetical protein